MLKSDLTNDFTVFIFRNHIKKKVENVKVIEEFYRVVRPGE